MSTVAEPPKDSTNGDGVIHYVRIIRLVPICPEHGCPMARYSGGPGRRVYYECLRPGCQCKAPGETRRDYL